MIRRRKWFEPRAEDTAAAPRPAEAAKRARLRAEIAALKAPLFGVRLSPCERQAIADRVKGGLANQSMWPRSSGNGWQRGKN
jgi:hypothetical protein